MSVKCLSETAQSQIVHFITNEQYNQTELAELWQVSRRTIQRVLLDAGVIRYNTKAVTQQKTDPVSAHKDNIQDLQNHTMVNMLRDKGHTPTTLKDLMNTPALTRRNVELYLTRLPEEDLATLTYVIGLTRIKIQEREAAEQRQSREAANG